MLAEAISSVDPINPPDLSTAGSQTVTEMISIGLNKSNSILWVAYPKWLKHLRKRQSNNRIILKYYTVFQQRHNESRDSSCCSV